MVITFTLVMAMCAFSLAMSISPGPVNMVIVSSGINHGVRRTMPFVSGATIGFTMLLAFIGFGFIQILERFPLFLNYLTFAGAAFIIYLGIKVARSGGSLSVSEEENMATFWQGFALQWLNPKAWIACVLAFRCLVALKAMLSFPHLFYVTSSSVMHHLHFGQYSVIKLHSF